MKYHRELNVVTFVLALFECLCFAGIIFGWFSIRPVLEQEGFFGAQTHEKAISISKMMDKMGSGEKNANETINGPVSSSVFILIDYLCLYVVLMKQLKASIFCKN